MIETYNIEDIKDEITRWATVKTPTLYQHFAVYLGISTKEVKKLFTGNEAIQDHINQYFQEERIQENIERDEQLQRDLAYEGHINIFSDGQDSFGIYVQDIDYLGTFPAKIGFNHHSFSFTWNKRMCEEPKTNKKVPLSLQRIETTNKKGFYFQVPESFFLSHIPD